MAREKVSKTLLERYGFKDPDLSLPLHDQIIQWVADNIEAIALELGERRAFDERYDPTKKDWLPTGLAERCSKVQEEVAEASVRLEAAITECRREITEQKNTPQQRSPLLAALPGWSRSGDIEQELEQLLAEQTLLTRWSGLGVPPPFKLLEASPVRWEQPITTDTGRSKYVVGYLDLIATVYMPRLHITRSLGDVGRRRWARTGSDVQVPEWYCEKVPLETLCIEAKTEIRTVGELLRQINHYKEYQRGLYVVVSPDDRHRQVLESQGVEFIHYPHGKGQICGGPQQGALL